MQKPSYIKHQNVTSKRTKILELINISKVFIGEKNITALSNINFSLEKGKFVSILGPSGCGKSTMLRIMAGLLEPTKGKVLIDGKFKNPVNDVVLLFQDYSRTLLPWRSVLENVMLGMESLKMTKQDRKETAKQLLELVGIQNFALEFPWRLSGGMQQRVALARALAKKPRVLLMDEPFGSLDARSRLYLGDQLLKLWSKLHTSIIFVTHDIDEAIYLSQRIVLLTASPGKIRINQPVRLKYPRNQIASRENTEFLRLRRKIYNAFYNEEIDLEI